MYYSTFTEVGVVFNDVMINESTIPRTDTCEMFAVDEFYMMSLPWFQIKITIV